MIATTESNLQFVFNAITSGDIQTVQFLDWKQYEATRTALLRKFKRYLDLLSNLGGPNPFEGRFLRCSWNKEKKEGMFELADDRRKSNRPGGKILLVVNDVASE